ncbi:MAG: MFS transporter [Ardenticatenaceae bacterium]
MSKVVSVVKEEGLSVDEAPLGGGERFSVRQLIGIGLITRLFMATGTQMFFPFLPIIASGMGISTIAMGRLISLRSVVGLVSPFFGALADRRGYRQVMRIGLFLSALAYFLLGSSNAVWMAALGMMLAGLGSFIFTPALQAYLSARMPYARRARGLGVLEYSWALAGIVGLFAVGQLIEISSWRVPMFLIGGTLFVAGVFYKQLPSVGQLGEIAPTEQHAAREMAPTDSATQPTWKQVVSFFDLGANNRSTWATMWASGFIMFAALHVFISYGSWLSEEYGLSAGQLGQVAFVLGCGDLCGSVLVSVLNDRIGKRRGFLWGCGVSCVGFFVMPFFNTALVPAVIGIILARSSFEFTIVGSIPLLSEQVPEQRGKVLTLRSTTTFLGGVIAGFSSPWAYAHYGAWGLGLVSGVSMLIAFLLIVAFVRDAAAV